MATTLKILTLLLLTSCFSRSSVMTRENYENINLGDPIVEVNKTVGKPYTVRHLGHGTDEYEYLERLPLGEETYIINHYILIVTDGQVVGKTMNERRPPAYDLIYRDDPNELDD